MSVRNYGPRKTLQSARSFDPARGHFCVRRALKYDAKRNLNGMSVQERLDAIAAARSA